MKGPPVLLERILGAGPLLGLRMQLCRARFVFLFRHRPVAFFPGGPEIDNISQRISHNIRNE